MNSVQLYHTCDNL